MEEELYALISKQFEAGIKYIAISPQKDGAILSVDGRPLKKLLQADNDGDYLQGLEGKVLKTGTVKVIKENRTYGTYLYLWVDNASNL